MGKPTQRRKVYIRSLGGGIAWGVFYLTRKHRQRYMKAQFARPDYTVEEVIEWVNRESDLELVEPPKPKVFPQPADI